MTKSWGKRAKGFMRGRGKYGITGTRKGGKRTLSGNTFRTKEAAEKAFKRKKKQGRVKNLRIVRLR